MTKIKRRIKEKKPAPIQHQQQFLVSKKMTDEEKMIIREQERHVVMDFVSIALGRMGFRATRFQTFRETLGEVYRDYFELIEEVKTDDPELWEVEAKIDRELLQYCGKELFVPWEKRHS